MENRPKLLVSFLNHRVTDGRVFYRVVRHIVNTFGERIEVVAINLLRRDQSKLVELEEIELSCDSHTIHCYQICVPKSCSVINKIIWKLRIGNVIAETVKQINPDLFYIADVREIPAAVKALKQTGTSVIYDSHEDYVRQALDYGKNKALKRFTALRFAYYEKAFIRRFDAVFCTDEFLEKKYTRKEYHAKYVSLVRNYPYYDKCNDGFARTFAETDVLKSVYIGGVDPYRGVIESSEYIKKYNASHNRRVVLDIYGTENEISREISDNISVFFKGWIDHKELMMKLRNEYDIGLCLWQPIPKFYTNLPIKNFDYMGAGLPIITSNFGNLYVHATKSGAGFCIDPQIYDEFEQAIDCLFDPIIRGQYSSNGLKYVKEASFQSEAIPMMKVIETIINLKQKRQDR